MTGFRCKQFYVAHDQCGMKVNTDSIVLGAWANLKGVKSVLDIGTGSGILALMAAQRLSEANTHSQVVGVDIEAGAAAQAQANFKASNWASQLQAEQADISQWQSAQRFDFMISNPPYFCSGQSLACDKRQMARLEDSLSLTELLRQAQRFAHETSRFALIIPDSRVDEVVQAAPAFSWYLERSLAVTGKEGKAVHRMVLEFRAQPLSAVEKTRQESLCIRDLNNDYTEAFKVLTRPYYLAF